MKKLVFNYISLLVLVFVCSCSGTTYETIYPTLSDGKYDSEFPYRNCSEQLEDIANSLSKIDVLVFYNTYTFPLDSKITGADIRVGGSRLERIASTASIHSESVSGTALTIHYSGSHIAYLTCAHVVDFQDTAIIYYPPPYNEYVQAVSIKARQQNNISGSPSGGDIGILAMDVREDIAILGKEISGDQDDKVNVFDYPVGDSEELEWGSFVYIMGYPLGNAMITRGIVSDPKRIKKGSFLIDAVFNQGFSGGPVIAVRDGVPNFEMVGMVKSSAALNKYRLIPEEPEHPSDLIIGEPYTGQINVSMEKEIKYGVTFSVTTETLRNFFKEHQELLEEKGYYLEGFFED